MTFLLGLKICLGASLADKLFPDSGFDVVLNHLCDFDFGHSFVFPSKFDDLLVTAKLGDLALQFYAMPNFVDDMASKHAVRNSFWWSTKAER